MLTTNVTQSKQSAPPHPTKSPCVSSHRANWTNIEAAVEVDPEHETTAEVYAPRTHLAIFITGPEPLLLTAENRVYV